ncbi:GNAT family N-acetyltransferase [Candidatus Bathyarchaeota archaeon]|nr:MAG: GNAT family N-acetyltransferase [Candidatus Bathyarchaeota archaeon]
MPRESEMIRSNLELRKFQPSEYERFAEIRDSIFPDYSLSAQELKSFDDNLDKSKYYLQRFSCFSKVTGEIVALGELGHMPWMFNPRKFQGRILVDPNHQNRGVGEFIYDDLMKQLANLQAVEVWSFAREDMAHSLSFMTKRGFEERFRTWESRLNPAAVDMSHFSHYSEKASKAGVEITSLARELEADPDCHKKLYELNQELMSDVPMPESYTPISYEQWLSFDMKDPGLVPEAYAIAKDRSTYIGLSTIRRLDKEPHGLFQALTGVRREYRGKGIAFAMKLKVIEYAQKNGFERIKTENATTNVPMLGINTRLGFKREVGWIAFSRRLR